MGYANVNYEVSRLLGQISLALTQTDVPARYVAPRAVDRDARRPGVDEHELVVALQARPEGRARRVDDEPSVRQRAWRRRRIWVAIRNRHRSINHRALLAALHIISY